MDGRLKVLRIGIAFAMLALVGAWKRGTAPTTDDGGAVSVRAEPPGEPASSRDHPPDPALPTNRDGNAWTPPLPTRSIDAWAELAIRYGKALREVGLHDQETDAAHSKLGVHLMPPVLGRGDPFEYLLVPERDRLVPHFLEGFGLPLNATQVDQLHGLVEEERLYWDKIHREPPGESWIDRSRLYTAQACEWDRRLEGILDAAQVTAVRFRECGLTGLKQVVLTRYDPRTSNRADFRKDLTGESLARNWVADIFWHAEPDSRMPIYAREYIHLMLEIGVPDYEVDGRASLAYRLRQLEIQASLQKMMLEDLRFTEEELTQIRIWHELYEGVR